MSVGVRSSRRCAVRNFVGPARRMERVAQADQAARADLVGDRARDPAAQRLAADDQAIAAAEGDNRAAPGGAQPLRRVGHAAPGTGFAPGAHVGELEAGDAPTARRPDPPQPPS